MPEPELIPADLLLHLWHRLDRLPPRSPERADQVAAVAEFYGVSATTVYRALRTFQKPRAAQRADRGKQCGPGPDDCSPAPLIAVSVAANAVPAVPIVAFNPVLNSR